MERCAIPQAEAKAVPKPSPDTSPAGVASPYHYTERLLRALGDPPLVMRFATSMTTKEASPSLKATMPGLCLRIRLTRRIGKELTWVSLPIPAAL